MCLDATMFFDQNWLESRPAEPAPVQAQEPVPVQVQARVRADVFVLSIETELYAAVMYDKRKRIDQHALSTI